MGVRWRRGVVALVVATCVAACSAPTAGHDSPSGDALPIPEGSSTQHVTVDGIGRDYRVFRPAASESPVPLVLVFHGYTGNAEQTERTFEWDALAEQDGFAVAYPQGIQDSWNAGTCCGQAQAQDVDDVAATLAIVDDVAARAGIDPGRMYVTGLSNGGAMTYRLACETDVFAAFGPVAGGQLVDCAGAAPTSILHIHGAADTLVPFAGDPNGTGMGHPPIDQTMAQWRDRDRCTAPVATDTDGVHTQRSSCPDGREISVSVVDGLGHAWPTTADRSFPTQTTTLDATETLWSFFHGHSR